MTSLDARMPLALRAWAIAAVISSVLPMIGCSGNVDDSESKSMDSVEQTSTDEPDGIPSVTPSVVQPDNAVDQSPRGTGESGSLAGVISFEGELPPPRIIQATKDPEVCMKGEAKVQDVRVKEGKLAGTVVELTVRGADVGMEPPPDGFVIRQKNCRFTNPTLVAYDGAELTIYNDDPIQHNVNSGQWNQIQGPGPDPIRQKINFSGVPFVRVTCNIHNWMETWVYVAQSEFHAVSGDDGSFRIDGIPPGRYRGTVIHPTLGRQRLSVVIEAGQTHEESFVFKAP